MNRRTFLQAAAGCMLSTDTARATSELVHIGLVESLFRDTPRLTVQVSVKRFRRLMRRETGIDGDSVTLADVWTLADRLAHDRLQLGVCNGFELAWARQDTPRLRPLVVAVNQQPYVRALVVVPTTSTAKGLPELRGAALAVPERTKEYCRLFLDRECRRLGCDAKSLFVRIHRPHNLEDALDDVVDGSVQAALVDGVGFKRYQVRKPVRAAKLRDLVRSPAFPPSAVVCLPEALAAATRENFRRALLELDRSAEGRQILLEWRLTGLEPVPRDYDAALDGIAKQYPPPPR